MLPSGDLYTSEKAREIKKFSLVKRDLVLFAHSSNLGNENRWVDGPHISKDVLQWFNRKYVEVDYYLTQLLLGWVFHGCPTVLDSFER